MILFDLILATRRPALTGIERYGLNLFEATRRIAPDTCALVHDDAAFADKKGLILVSHAYRDWMLAPAHIARAGLSPDMIVFPTAPASPLFRPTNQRLLRIVHDVFPWTRAQEMKPLGRILFRDVENFMLKRYDRLCATTEPVAEDMARLFGRADIDWCGNAPGIDLAAVTPKPVENLPQNFLLAVGTIEPRKDYARLISLAEEASEGAPPIVIVGRPGWGDIVEKLQDALQRMPGGLIWLSELVDDGALAWLYRHAWGFISLSHAEGFNMPLCEAAMLGQNILCSDLPIHRVVAPPWARFASREDPPAALWAALLDTQAPLAEAINAYRRRYSWDTVARKLISLSERRA